MQIEETQPNNQNARDYLLEWRNEIQKNIFTIDTDYQHSVQFSFNQHLKLQEELTDFGAKAVLLDQLVIENNLAQNLPRLERYDGIGQRIETIVHHPNYIAAGDLIYSSNLLGRMAKPGGLLEALTFMFLSSQAGEAGHNCPIACGAGMIRILQKVPDFPAKNFYLQKLCEPSFQNNFTGAQFLTEVQGGSDVGQNATLAVRDEENNWRIRGEKWFCSNANAELILMTARYDTAITGTKGLGLFLVPTVLENGEPNYYTIRRLKEKIGTKSMASGEIDFHNAYALAMGEPKDGFKMVMENVLHISRLFNTFCMLGMARRAYFIARAYAQYRIAFGQAIIHYPLVKENLARIKAENTAMLAAIFATTKLQDQHDTGVIHDDKTKLILRLLANLNKYISALWSVEHIHHAIDMLAGNGAIETFSILPRLLRDSIVCENWEGTHNTLRIQILKDIERFEIDSLFLNYLNDELNAIKHDASITTIIKNELQKLQQQTQGFKNLSNELKNLEIKSLVDKMIILYCTVCLYKEALNQVKKNNYSKMHCLEYFILLHLNSNELQYDETYLKLITQIVG